jgi:hypothetical protein
VLVDVARHDLLADPALASQQDRGIAVCATRARQAQESWLTRIDGDHATVIKRARASDNAMDMVEQRFRLEGLEQKVAGTRPHRFDRPVDIGESGHQDHRQMRQSGCGSPSAGQCRRPATCARH